MSCCNNWLCSVIKIGMIIHEILDKYVDIATAVEYYKGRLFYNPKESVYKALLTFTIIGGIISVAKISLYVRGIYLDCTGNESCDKCDDDFNLGMQSIKVIFEAFPQSAIAKFGFVHCPIKKYGWGIRFLDPAFDSFCGTPFIFFVLSLCCYCYKHRPRIKCCDKREYAGFGGRERSKNVRICCCSTLFCSTALFITFVLFRCWASSSHAYLFPNFRNAAHNYITTVG